MEAKNPDSQIFSLPRIESRRPISPRLERVRQAQCTLVVAFALLLRPKPHQNRRN
jgi:hypothetical protein